MLIVILIIVAVIVIAGIACYNGLVSSRNACDTADQQISTQLQRRFDLIPNLVETAKGYSKHESETLKAVIEARSAGTTAIKNGSTNDALAADGKLTKSLWLILNAVGEAYPDLKANQNFLSLQEQLTTTENQVAYARQAFNDAVLAYNNQVEKFPSSIIAGMFHFERKEGFKVESEDVRHAPKVQF